MIDLQEDVKVENVKEVESNTSIQMFVMLKMLSFLDKYTQEAREIISLAEEEENKLLLLRSMNFTQSKTFLDIQNKKYYLDERNKEAQKFREGVRFLGECFRIFGNGVRLITYDDFNALIQKYDLRLTAPSGYTGEIPDKNLQDLVKINRILQNIDNYNILKRHLQDAYYHDHTITKGPYFKECSIGKMFIVAPLEEIDYRRVDYEINERIAARERERTMDPLVCSYTDIGVLIYTAWGEEADDAVFEKYDTLNNAIKKIKDKVTFNNNNSGSLKVIESHYDINANLKAFMFIFCFITIFGSCLALSPMLQSLCENNSIFGLIMIVASITTVWSLFFYGLYGYFRQDNK